MAWTDLTFSNGSKLTATKMTQVVSNFAAMAAGEAGAPPLAVNSFMASGVSSLGMVNADSGFMTSGVSSLGLVNADSGYMTTEVASFGGMDVSSAMTVRGAAASPPTANTLYKDNIPKGWVNFDGTGVIAIQDSFNVASITDNATGNYTVTWDTDFANANYACVTGGTGTSNSTTTNPVQGPAFASPSVGSIIVFTGTDTLAKADWIRVCVAAFGDQ